MIFNSLFTKYLIENKILEKEFANEWLTKSNAIGTPIYLELVKMKF